jgi:hypothetical protein
MISFKQHNLGEFQEASVGNYFTYRFTSNDWANQQGFTHEIDVTDGVRFARVMKTVVQICTDEDANGSAVFETWKIKKHITYNKQGE